MSFHFLVLFTLDEKVVNNENLETLGSKETSSSSKYQTSAFLFVDFTWFSFFFFFFAYSKYNFLPTLLTSQLVSNPAILNTQACLVLGGYCNNENIYAFFSAIFVLWWIFLFVSFCFVFFWLYSSHLQLFQDLQILHQALIWKKTNITYEQPQYCYTLITVASWTT